MVHLRYYWSQLCKGKWDLDNVEDNQKSLIKKKKSIISICLFLFFFLFVMLIHSESIEEKIYFVEPNDQDLHSLDKLNDVTISDFDSRPSVRLLRSLQHAMYDACSKLSYSAVFAHNFQQSNKIIYKKIVYFCEQNIMLINPVMIHYEKNNLKKNKQGKCYEKYGNTSKYKKRFSVVTFNYSTVFKFKITHNNTFETNSTADACLVQHAHDILNNKF